jgi:hypothetical protein
MLPGSKAVLFTANATAGNWDNGSIVVQTLISTGAGPVRGAS